MLHLIVVKWGLNNFSRKAVINLRPRNFLVILVVCWSCSCKYEVCLSKFTLSLLSVNSVSWFPVLVLFCPFFLFLSFYFMASQQVTESLVYLLSPHWLTRCLMCLQGLSTAVHFIIKVCVNIIFKVLCFRNWVCFSLQTRRNVIWGIHYKALVAKWKQYKSLLKLNLSKVIT